MVVHIVKRSSTAPSIIFPSDAEVFQLFSEFCKFLLHRTKPLLSPRLHLAHCNSHSHYRLALSVEVPGVTNFCSQGWSPFPGHHVPWIQLCNCTKIGRAVRPEGDQMLNSHPREVVQTSGTSRRSVQTDSGISSTPTSIISCLCMSVHGTPLNPRSAYPEAFCFAISPH